MPIQKKKPMSFGKLIGLFIGGMALIMVLTYAVIMGMSGNKKKTVRQPVAVQQMAPQPVPSGPRSADIERANLETRQAVSTLNENMRILQEQNVAVMTSIRTEIDTLKSQLAQLKTAQTNQAITAQKVEVVKPDARGTVTITPPMVEYNGMPVTAVVGDTIWVLPNGASTAVPVRFGQPIAPTP